MYNPKVSAKERRDRAIEALISVGLESRLNHLPSELSGGQQQRVAIARSLVNQPVILLADEATGNLDTKTSYEVMELFQRLNDQGSTIGFVTHEDDIAQFSKRTVVLKDGHIISDKETLTYFIPAPQHQRFCTRAFWRLCRSKRQRRLCKHSR